MTRKVIFEILNKDELVEEIKKEMQKDPKYKPVRVTVNAPYGLWLEFGSGPMIQRLDGRSYDRIRDWAIAHGVDSERIFHRIKEKGIYPQPFFRPAMHEIKNKMEYHPDEYSNKSLLEIGKELKEKIEENAPRYTGTLANSVTVEEIDDPNMIRKREYPSDITDDMWYGDVFKGRYGKRGDQR